MNAKSIDPPAKRLFPAFYDRFSVGAKARPDISENIHDYHEFNLGILGKTLKRMTLSVSFSKVVSPTLLVVIGLLAGPALGVTQYKKERKPFTLDPKYLRPSLSLQIEDNPLQLILPEIKMKKRIHFAPKDETVEPLTVILTESPEQMHAIAEKIAKPKYKEQLFEYFEKTWPDSEPTKPESKSRYVEINAKAFKYVDRVAFGNFYGRTHHQLTIDSRQFEGRLNKKKRELLKQVRHFMDRDDRRELAKKIHGGERIDVDAYLLPEFARKMVGRYIVYRGPNCFHAALAFHSPKMTSSSRLNVKEEDGYHRAMINYDELWRVLSTKFYEVDPSKTKLKYGDLLVFFDVPEGLEDDTPVDYRWIRHTAAYLFDNYAFSKGSKSPNTPYSVRTLQEEWDTWNRYTENLGIKVFRRSEKRVRKAPPKELSDWIY